MTYTHSFNSITDQVKGLLLQKMPATLKHLLPNGVYQKNQFFVGNVKGNPGDSLVIELRGSKAGLWHDLATHEGGDILHLWAAVNGIDIEHDFPTVISSAQKWLGLPVTGSSSANSLALTTIVEVPMTIKTTPEAKPESKLDFNKPTGKWTYTDVDGNAISSVYRYDTVNGKEFRPYDIKAGKYQKPAEPRPLYNLPGIKAAQKVVIVEGEKAAQALIDAGICATTAMFGANTPVNKTDWSPLKYKEILIWPDNDDAGKKYTDAIVEKLKIETLHSLSIVMIPEDKPTKWDSADAIAEKEDINAILSHKTSVVPALTTLYDGGHAMYKTEPVPTDLVGPRILTEGGFCLIGGAPKAGKSDFLMHWLAHMATGRDFLGMITPRPLRVVYLQSELRYHFICERIQHMMKDDLNLIPLFQKNFFFTPHMKMTLDKDGVELMRRTILYHFRDNPIDVIAVDPLRYVFDGGPNNQSENDNSAMKLFLRDRMDALRDAVNPNAANILVHHTKKITTEQLEEEEFQALSGAGVLHGHFSTGILIYRPDKTQSYRKTLFELRDGESVDPKYVERINGKWHRIEHASERLVGQEYGCKLDAEHRRKQDVIVQLIRNEAYKGSVYTVHQFCEAFGHDKVGLGGVETIRCKLNMLATNGHIKFFKNGDLYGLPKPCGTKRGYMCVENMRLGLSSADKKSDKIMPVIVCPTHFKCRKSGSILPESNPRKWTYFDEEKL